MIDRTSDTWLTLKKHLEQRIELARNGLEIQVSPQVISNLQGQVSVLREIIALGEPALEPAVEPVSEAPRVILGHPNHNGDNSGY